MEIKIPKEHFTITHKFDPQDFAPGVWAGNEGMTLTITKVDLENRVITLELVKEDPGQIITLTGIGIQPVSNLESHRFMKKLMDVVSRAAEKVKW